MWLLEEVLHLVETYYDFILLLDLLFKKTFIARETLFKITLWRFLNYIFIAVVKILIFFLFFVF
jgi:1-acyl-sn-glycerol-3-phosphate acyltransferase